MELAFRPSDLTNGMISVVRMASMIHMESFIMPEIYLRYLKDEVAICIEEKIIFFQKILFSSMQIHSGRFWCGR